MLEWYWCLIIGGMIGWALRGWLDFRAINKRQREDAVYVDRYNPATGRAE